MEKYMEENVNNPDREEDIRVNKNDINKKKKTGKGFIAIEEIPQKELTEDETSEQEEGADVEDFYDRSIKEEYKDDTDAEESDKRKIEQLNKELKYHEGGGVASVYTEDLEDGELKHNPIDWGKYEKPKKEEEFPDIEKEITPRIGRRKTNEPITSMSHDKVIQNKRYSSRKDERYFGGQPNTGAEHDNMKTLKTTLGKNDRPKLERSWGKRIKDFLFKQNNEETPEHTLEQKFEEHSFVEDPETVTHDEFSLEKNIVDWTKDADKEKKDIAA